MTGAKSSAGTSNGIGPALIAFLRQNFTRVTSSVAFIPQIDGLRALALLLVFVHHVFAFYLVDTHRLGTQKLPQDWARIAPMSPLVPWGLHLAIGIPIFCAISGLVLAIPFARSYKDGVAPPSRTLYLLRRLVRMEPPYAVSMVFLFLMLMTRLHKPPLPLHVAWEIFGSHLAASLVYLHAMIYGGKSWINGAAWTLEIEIQFYLLLPLIAELFRNQRRVLRRAIWIALILSFALFAQIVLPQLHSARLDLSVAKQLQYFLAGVLLADIYLDPPKRLQLSGRAADVLALIAAVLLIYVLHCMPLLEWSEPLLLAAFFWAVFRGHWSSRLFALPILTIPGTMCYTIYLYHIFIVQQLLPYTIRFVPPVHSLALDTCLHLLLLAPPVLLISAVLFVAFERPFVVLSHRVAHRYRPTALAPAAEVQEVGA